MNGRIFDVKRFTIHDGLGIRTTVFFKGCPLACAWCHNPEGLSAEREMLVRHERCVRCRACARACPRRAIRMAPRVTIDKGACGQCGACEAACPTRAIRYGWRDVADDELVEELMADKLFFEAGGGVTLSGGEPLMQPEFALAVLEGVRARGVHTCVETSMMAPRPVMRAVAEAADQLMVDIKLMDDAAHRRYTGASNEEILENFRYLAGVARDVTVRVPLVPGVTATDENVGAIVRFVRACGGDVPIELLNFNSLAASKYAMVGARYFDAEMRALPTEEFERLQRLTRA